MGISPRTRVITRRGRNNLQLKQHGKREFIKALEAVSADGFVFQSYLIGKTRYQPQEGVRSPARDAVLGGLQKCRIVPYTTTLEPSSAKSQTLSASRAPPVTCEFLL